MSNNVVLDDVKKLLLSSLNPLFYSHVLGVFSVAEDLLARGEPILTERDKERAESIIAELEGGDRKSVV